MKKLLLAIAALVLAAPVAHAQVPDGPYRSSCINAKVVGTNLVAACRMGNSHNYNNTVLFLPCNGQIGATQAGVLTCNGVPGPAWSPTANYVAFTISGSGSIATSVGGACDKNCTLLLNAVSLATITATPKDASHAFDSWDGDCKGATGNICYLNTTLPHRVTANFRPVQQTSAQHTLSVSPALHGTIVDAGTGGRYLHCSHADIQHCSATFASGATIMLDTIPDPGYRAVAWGGDCAYTSRATCALPMSADRRATAIFGSAGASTATAPVAPPVSPPAAAMN